MIGNMPAVSQSRYAGILTQKSYEMGELITQVYAKANEREMDILTELIEAPGTIKLIADTLAKVRKPILVMKQLAHFLSSNKGLRGTAQYADKASEFWLQYRYGFFTSLPDCSRCYQTV